MRARVRTREQQEEEYKKKFELPPYLKHFGVSLNRLARADKLPPTIGREREIQQMIEILCHRERANSPMLVGEPGVGKTAVVEGLARLIELEPEKVPSRLRGTHVVQLQMGGLVAGTMLRGMFEERIKGIIDEVKERDNLILFIDEAHTIIGAGAALGTSSRRRQHVQDGARARRDAHRRRDDHHRVQGVHRRGRGARAPLPPGQG